ncbi:MAG: ribose-phosphate pyrophosphokinase [Pseudomonadales bacterium]|nr:ribose-phosphate pyrophosphokinase [Candidatus Woesebacteria bacterium]MCB9802062.1 ribose-phosphate pyrophosphokinase [Pseudomonadales bacterium]
MPQSTKGRVFFLSGSSHINLTEELARRNQAQVLKRDIARFANGEVRVRLLEDCRGQDVTIVQSFSTPINTRIIETLLLIDALERSRANSITLIISWLGYSLQNKVFQDGEPLAAQVIAQLLSRDSIKHIHLLDVHSPTVLAFFTKPVSEHTALPLFQEYIVNNLEVQNCLVVSPDAGGVRKAAEFAQMLGIKMVQVEKSRDYTTGKVSVGEVDRDLRGKNILLLDDVIMSGSTAIETSNQLKRQGVKDIYFFATHGVFTGSALEQLEKSSIDRVLITNSIAHEGLPEKVVELECSGVFTW